MKKTAIVFLIMMASPAVFGADNRDISEGPEIDSCWRNQQDRGRAATCLHELNDKSNKSLDLLIEKTVKQIKKNNTGPVYKSNNAELTIGDVFSKHFLESQQSWKSYRNDFCLGVGSQIGEDAYDYWPSIYQCQINLNRRHAEEIKMLHADEE